MSRGHLDLRRWFEAHSRPLGLYGRQWLDDHASADVVQDAFLKLLSQQRPPLLRPDPGEGRLTVIVR